MAFLDETGLAELWRLVKAEDAKLATVDVKVASGSYTGTGAYGASSPCGLAFNFAPKLIMIVGKKYASSSNYETLFSDLGTIGTIQPFLYTTGLSTGYVQGRGLSYGSSMQYAYGRTDNGGKTVYWYSTDGASAQFNVSSYTYYYIAIG